MDHILTHSPKMAPPRYRSLTSADIPAAHGLSLIVRWPHRPEDWQFAADAGTGFVAEENGAVIGTALCWKFGADRASLGLVIVSPQHQGRGIGRKLLEMVLEELGPRITLLHATAAGRPLYEKLGFSACGSLDQHQGEVMRILPVTLPDGERLRASNTTDLPKLIDLASRATGLERSAMLPALLQVAKGMVLERDNEIIGFSVFRRFGRGHVIGPVVALHSPDDLRAKALIACWLTGRDGDYVRIDAPTGATLTDWLTRQGLPRVDTVLKMVRNAPAEAHSGAPDPAYRSYGLISQAMF